MNRMENLSRVCQKQKRKKNMKKLSFITWFTIEFLLLFTGWREVLGKMPEIKLIVGTSEFRNASTSLASAILIKDACIN